jgi:ATPase subunit of ABC transporter with duplicated ATPase domains
VLLVTHDREFLAHAAVTRTVEVAEGRVTVRG